MRITKDAIERKNEILDVAEKLFNEKGFDHTGTSDIAEKTGIAKGTLYYHFKSKEDIMDALIERRSAQIWDAAKKAAGNENLPVLERLFQTLLAMNIAEQGGSSEMIEHIHKPQNALMHQKVHDALLAGIPPILMPVMEEGIRQGIFDTPYPYESLEIGIIYANTVFDDTAAKLPKKELAKKIEAFIFNLERLFGAKQGSFLPILNLFQMSGPDPGGKIPETNNCEEAELNHTAKITNIKKATESGNEHE